MTYSDSQIGLLLETLRRTELCAKQPEPPAWISGDWDVRQDAARRRRDREDQRKFGPLYSSYEWFGCENGSAQQRALSRAVKKLEGAGLLIGTNDSGGRLRHIRLTPDGETLARQLANAAAASLRDAEGIP